MSNCVHCEQERAKIVYFHVFHRYEYGMLPRIYEKRFFRVVESNLGLDEKCICNKKSESDMEIEQYYGHMDLIDYGGYNPFKGFDVEDYMKCKCVIKRSFLALRDLYIHLKQGIYTKIDRDMYDNFFMMYNECKCSNPIYFNNKCDICKYISILFLHSVT